MRWRWRRRSTAERRDKGARGPLHGIPVLLKDNIDTADRMRTSAGSLALADNIAARDAFVVERLRAAGCVVLGKTNLSEWANFRGARSTSAAGARAAGRRAIRTRSIATRAGRARARAPRRPRIFARSTVGTETDGSIVSPASICGLVGLKPTVGLVSRIGHHADRAQPGHRRPDDAQRRRCRRLALGHDRR